MEHIIVIRPYKSGDELNCSEMMKEGVMSSMQRAFFGNLFKEVTFQFMILLAAIMFIFFGIPLSICLLVIPVVVVLTYIATYLGHAAKAMEVQSNLAKVSRFYMSNVFSCFWVAEAFEPFLISQNPRDKKYTVMTEKQFRELNIDVSMKSKKIVGSISVSKSHRVDRGAWIKNLCVHESYRRKGVAAALLEVAINFAMQQGYSCVNIVSSEYTEGGRELCLKKGFELKQMYNKPILGNLVTILMYELTYLLKPSR